MASILRVKDDEGNIIEIPAIKGDSGKSAYQVWLDADNSGTEEDFLNSLNGKSAYQVWLDADNSGTEEDFLNSLKGTTPVKGVDYYTSADKSQMINDIIDAITPTVLGGSD